MGCDGTSSELTETERSLLDDHIDIHLLLGSLADQEVPTNDSEELRDS